MGKITLFTHANNARSIVIDDPLAQAAVTLNVAVGDGAKFPSTFPFRLTIWDKTKYPNPRDDTNMEIVECTARATDALTIVRAKESTSDVAHAQGQTVEQNITDEVLTTFENAIPKETIINLYSKQVWANDTSAAPASLPETTMAFVGADYANCDIYFEVVMKIDATYTGYADLYNLTDPGAVANSEVSTTQTDPTIVRSGSPISFASGSNTYIMRYWTSDSAGWVNIYAFRLIFIHKA